MGQILGHCQPTTSRHKNSQIIWNNKTNNNYVKAVKIGSVCVFRYQSNENQAAMTACYKSQPEVCWATKPNWTKAKSLLAIISCLRMLRGIHAHLLRHVAVIAVVLPNTIASRHRARWPTLDPRAGIIAVYTQPWGYVEAYGWFLVLLCRPGGWWVVGGDLSAMIMLTTNMTALWMLVDQEKPNCWRKRL